jgi:hypothetical protein
MTKILWFVRVCILSVVILPSFTYADSNEIYLRLGASVQDFGYKEFNDQNVLIDREDGLMPGLLVEIGNKWQDVAGIFRFELFDGLVDYDGQTNSGIPLKTRTDERVTNIEVLLRYAVKSFAKNNVNLSVGLGDHKWRRDILATNITSGLLEIYHWKYFTVGGAADFWQRGKWSAGIDIRLLRPIQPTMSLDLNGYDAATLNLESRNSVRLNFPLHFVDGTRRQWTFTPYWESWRLGRSADLRLTSGGVPTSTIAHEPRSETNNVGVTISLRL